MHTADVHVLPNLAFDELEARCVGIDWRAYETEIVEAVSNHLAPDDALGTTEDGGSLVVAHRGARHRIPLTFTQHDRYVAVSSLAHILSGRYRFWLLKERLGDDTHSLLVLPAADSDALERGHAPWVEQTLERLELGKDYFHGLSVPYTGNESNNPDIQAQAEALRQRDAEAAAHLKSTLRQVTGRFGWKLLARALIDAVRRKKA